MPHLVITSISPDKAKELAGKAIRDRHCACAHIVPAGTSIYWWDGKVEEDNESLILFKVSSEKCDGLMSFIDHEHPYDVPEIIAVELDKVDPKYLDWLESV